MPMDNSVCAQTAADLEKLKAWLSIYPYWDDCMQVDFTQVRPGFSGLLPKGAEETSRREDVLGNRMVGCRYHFTLFWQMTGQGDDGEDAGRLLDFRAGSGSKVSWTLRPGSEMYLPWNGYGQKKAV